MSHILAIDQGTTSTRALVLDAQLTVVGTAQQEFPQHFPHAGWVEHDPEDIWRTTLDTARQALGRSGVPTASIAGLGITNQRETCVVWDRRTGQPIHRAIVWQDRRTADMCARLKAEGAEAMVAAKTGLLLDPYFSGTKIAWLLDNVSGARAAAEAGHLAFGTIDTFLLWRLTGGAVHATDATNASRTLLYDIRTGQWDDELLELLAIPRSLLPDVRDCAAEFGTCDTSLFEAAIPIRGIAGDQQAAMLGQACFAPGMMKSTYGTGCFALLNTGREAIRSQNRLLTTVAYQLGGKRTYALEGSIFIAGAAVQWLRDGLGVIGTAAESTALAAAGPGVAPGDEVVLVPAFVGLGAPYWKPQARGALFGLTRGTGPTELARAALQSVAFQTRDLIEAMQRDWSRAGEAETVLRVDGGLAASDWTMQFLADMIAAPVDRPANTETTALGAAWLAGLQAGLMPGPEAFGAAWKRERRFEPMMDGAEREARYAHWRRAVGATLAFAQST
jgi:glycerol kinase